ncbi:MAG: bifunctional (p)ppGpp synthetase/guanosine-3',5'-bis(diphosphate) 3'-pyrophosphohydrolase [bacterium]|nr:bifunctional (p)ppGpp synthetase/guanosine-3',5'-bis(diphosphate) 3'-pyrophosphohydrolase [bacterium]
MASKEVNLTIDNVIDKVKMYNKDGKTADILKHAYEYACEKHFGQRRITGVEYIQHPLSVALILADIKADVPTVVAALLHDTIEDSDSTKEEIEDLFGKDVANLVDGVTKINKINFSSVNEQIVANQRKILVGLSEDVRVIIIKLADRLHNMRTLYVLSEVKQKRKAKETLEILCPVAHRLGMYKLKSELEDLALRYLNPDAFYDIVERLNVKKKERDENVMKMQAEVSKMLNEQGIKHEIKGRSKGIYSIYNKLSKGRNFNDIYDLLAIRILVDTEQVCYLVLGLIHSRYKPVPKRFKDYIAMPKTNLYQSLHTTVFGIDGNLFEIQIRTHEMHKIAEYGIASHWSYKENTNTSNKDILEQKLAIFRSIIELNEETSTPEEFIANMRNDVLNNDSIFVYTPKGDIIELPANATPVDFAYKVHSEIGNKLVGAVVNNNIVPLNYALKTGDIIKVNTSSSSNGPNRDWLDFVITSHAKNRIKSYYSKLDKDTNLDKGKEILEKEIKRNNIILSDFYNGDNINNILNKLKIKNLNDLYVAIALNRITVSSVIKIMYPDNDKLELINKVVTPNLKSNPTNDIIVGGHSDIKTTFASCCKPVKGDSIIGYITRGNGISVHRSNCRNVSSVDQRLIDIKWSDSTLRKYITDIVITTNDTDDNLLHIITKTSNNSIQIDSIVTFNKSESKVYNISLYVESKEKLDKYITDLLSLSFIAKVERIIE